MPNTKTKTIIPIQHKQISEDGWMLNLLSKNVATITSPQGKRQTAYFGFNEEQEAENFINISINNGDIERGIYRQAKYLYVKYEVKTWGANHQFIMQKALEDIEAGNFLFRPYLGILKDGIIMTYVFDEFNNPYRYKEVSEKELEVLCSQLEQAGWTTQDGTDLAKFFNRVSRKKVSRKNKL